MFSHVFVGVGDFDRALAFYEPLMASLGIEARFCERSRPWAGWQSSPGPRPLFLIGKPYDRLAASPGNGNMVAFLAQIEGAACCCSSRASGSDGISPQAARTTQTAHAQAETGSCCQSQKAAPVSRCAGFTGTLAFGERCGCQPDVSEASVAPATVVFEFAAYAGELLQIVVRDLERPQERDGPAERLFLRRLTTPSVDVFLRVLHLLD